MLTPRQNTLATLYGEKADYVPLSANAFQLCGFITAGMYSQPAETGYDPWGIHWTVTVEGAMPSPGFCMFEEAADWHKHVKVPDISMMDFKAGAAMEPQVFGWQNTEDKVMALITPFGLFERMVAFMGHANALCALVLEPEDCYDFLETITDFSIKVFDKQIDVYHPDTFIYSDDVATANGLFMSPELYRKMIKPFHKRIIDHVTSRGVLFEQHCCGKCEDIVGDFVENGARGWQSAQCMNDIAGLLDKYQGKLSIDGGWDTSGPCSYVGSTEEQIRAEVRRCLTEYKKPGYILFTSLLNDRGNSLFVGDDRMVFVEDEWKKHCMF